MDLDFALVSMYHRLHISLALLSVQDGGWFAQEFYSVSSLPLALKSHVYFWALKRVLLSGTSSRSWPRCLLLDAYQPGSIGQRMAASLLDSAC